MQEEFIQRLLDINHLFYQNFASSFSETRKRLQPGVQRLLTRLPLRANLVDLGCGNGELAVHLNQRGQRGVYLGLDFSLGLLEEAERALFPAQDQGFEVKFQFFNLAEPGNLPQICLPAQSVSALLSFATLHHLPGNALRQRVLEQVADVLRASDAPQPCFIHSEWQFLNSPRLAARVVPWEAIGLSERQVEPGDYLLDWRRGGMGLRYVHHFSPDELAGLAERTGFEIIESFLSDGESGNLGLYQIWRLRDR